MTKQGKYDYPQTALASSLPTLRWVQRVRADDRRTMAITVAASSRSGHHGAIVAGAVGRRLTALGEARLIDAGGESN
jgi:hypothetical protein